MEGDGERGGRRYRQSVKKAKKDVKISGMAFLCTWNYEVFFRAQVILGGFLHKILYFIKYLKSYFLNFSWKAVF